MAANLRNVLPIASKRTFLNIAGRGEGLETRREVVKNTTLMSHTGRLTALDEDDSRLPARNDDVFLRLGAENYVLSRKSGR